MIRAHTKTLDPLKLGTKALSYNHFGYNYKLSLHSEQHQYFEVYLPSLKDI